MPRKTAVALFRMETGHDCLAEHLCRINCLPTPICSLCDDAIMNRHHLGECKSLMNSSLAALYWESRGKMMQISYSPVPLDYYFYYYINTFPNTPILTC